MKVVGVREVKNHLSEYLRQVRRGTIVRITDRGLVVAELRPPPAPDAAAVAFERLVEEGKVLPPTRPWSAALVAVPRRRARFSAGFANELLDADRDERA